MDIFNCVAFQIIFNNVWGWSASFFKVKCFPKRVNLAKDFKNLLYHVPRIQEKFPTKFKALEQSTLAICRRATIERNMAFASRMINGLRAPRIFRASILRVSMNTNPHCPDVTHIKVTRGERDIETSHLQGVPKLKNSAFMVTLSYLFWSINQKDLG